MNKIFAILTASLLLSGCGTDAETTLDNEELRPIGFCPKSQVNIDPSNSLFITRQSIVGDARGPFSLRRVLTRFGLQNGNPNVDATHLFKQFWDTQNPGPSLDLGPHCTDNRQTLNGFPAACRTAEGAQALVRNPDAVLDAYVPLALVNRFDLAPKNGANCGEYRIVYSKGNCPECGFGRNFVIFEAVLPNPNPECGLAACAPVQQMWATLSGRMSEQGKQRLLETFYFDGLAGFSPVIHKNNFEIQPPTRRNYRPTATGQIRTNQFMTRQWMLKEFKLQQTCNGRALCDLDFQPVAVSVNPHAPLFDPNQVDFRAADFQRDYVTQVASLAVPSLSGFGQNLARRYDDAQSPVTFTERYDFHFGQGDPRNVFRASIQGELASIGSRLTPEHIVARSEFLSCKGCHQNSNGADLGGGLVGPQSLGFVHVGENAVNGAFPISNALTQVFLPERERIMEAFLSQANCISCGKIELGTAARGGSDDTLPLNGRSSVH